MSFATETFNADSFVSEMMVNLPESEAKKQQEQLREKRSETGDKLIDVVKRNHHRLLICIGAVSALEGDLVELGVELTKFRSVMTSMKKSPQKTYQERARDISPAPLIEMKPDEERSNARPLGRTSWTRKTRGENAAASVVLELDALMSERKLEQACVVVENYRRSRPSRAPAKKSSGQPSAKELETQAQDELVEHRIAHLKTTLVELLTNPNLRKGESLKIISYLGRLGEHEEARNAFLSSRHVFIHQSIRKLKVESYLSLYIRNMTRLVFATIYNCAIDYREAFPTQSTAPLVVWTTQEVHELASLFSRYVFNATEFAIIKECIDVAMTRCALLDNIGLHIAPYLRGELNVHLLHRVRQYYTTTETALSNHLQEEDWYPSAIKQDKLIRRAESNAGFTSNLLEVSKLLLTESAQALYIQSQRFVAEVAKILPLSLLPSLYSMLSTLFEGFLLHILELVSRKPLNDTQLLGCLGDVSHIVNHLLPLIAAYLEDRFPDEQDAPMQQVLKGAAELKAGLHVQFVQQKASFIVRKNLAWSWALYADLEAGSESEEAPAISTKFQRLTTYLTSLVGKLERQLQNVEPQCTELVQQLVTDLFAAVVDKMQTADELFWSVAKETRRGRACIKQLVTDLKFLYDSSDENWYSSEQSNEAINAMIHMAKDLAKSSETAKSDWKAKALVAAGGL